MTYCPPLRIKYLLVCIFETLVKKVNFDIKLNIRKEIA
jgi:hypothetical protein